MDQSTSSAEVAPQQPLPPRPTNSNGEFVYSSNPFIAAGKGLAKLLNKNTIAALILPLYLLIPIFLFILGVGVSIALAFGNGGDITGVIIVLVGVASFIIGFGIIIRLIAAGIKLLLASYADQEMTAKEAFSMHDRQQYRAFIGMVILAALAVIGGLILLIIPGIIIGVRFSLAGFAVYDEKLGAKAALKRSWNLSRGHFWEVLSANLAQGMLIGSGLLGFSGGSSGIANRYIELKQAESLGVETGKTHWMNFVLPLLFVPYLAFTGLSSYLSSSTTSPLDNTDSSSNFIDDLDFSDFDANNASSFCYISDGASSLDDFKCVTKSECREIAICKQNYGDALD